MGVKFSKERREWRPPGLLYTNNLEFCGKLKDNLKVMTGHFVEICKRRGLKDECR